MEFRRYGPADLPGVLRLCELEQWPGLRDDPERANRVLTAPGVTTFVAVEAGAVVGFAQLQSDGEIQAHLSQIAVHPDHRRRGIGRELIVRALREAGGKRIDLITEAAEEFYAALPHFRRPGFRLYPFYSGPDQYRPEITWKDGRVVGR
ncbi:MAG TPA: GNAT family N-acetyltransferase [Caulobacteraceae bacterium]|nr:GNAT family N-acetyltransferase [Caulobacteraceae bacterium]